MDQLKAAFEKAGISPIDIVWFEHKMKRRFAPLPDCKLRRMAESAGFHSSREFLAAESKLHARAER